ncbi:hypothetical protein OB955_03770 [Halobacteria archaeon AArc-m2/3/4]|uniref:Uncharacterized protein n=1 Tax=Natronoglomus mannanivorans TaxID=2979990 RepID=A0ABT2QA99_9EURY|nr:hypothetical protein [Halobacteria archaeon AArc-m2/3/4]
MTRSIDSITHAPNEYVRITINHDNGDRERVEVAVHPARATVSATYDYTPEKALMAVDWKHSKYDDRVEVHETIDHVLAGLDVDDDVHRTIDRLERVGYWMDEQEDLVSPDDVLLDVHGDYKPLRSGQDILLVQADNPTWGGQRAFVMVADELPPVDELRESLDDRVERRVMRNMCPQKRTYYKKEVDGRIRADIMEVESLEEAVCVVRGDQGENNDYGSDRKDGDSNGEQATLAGY